MPGFPLNCCLQGFQGFVLVVYLLFGCCYYFQASKGKGGVCGHLLGLSINNMVAIASIITPYVYKDSLVVIETI